jgi:hypothetical protein
VFLGELPPPLHYRPFQCAESLYSASAVTAPSRSTLRFVVRPASFRLQRQLHSSLYYKTRLWSRKLQHRHDQNHLLQYIDMDRWSENHRAALHSTLDYSNRNGEKIHIFARHIIPKTKAKTPEDEEKLPFRKPCLVPCSCFVVIYFIHCVSLVLATWSRIRSQCAI